MDEVDRMNLAISRTRLDSRHFKGSMLGLTKKYGHIYRLILGGELFIFLLS